MSTDSSVSGRWLIALVAGLALAAVAGCASAEPSSPAPTPAATVPTLMPTATPTPAPTPVATAPMFTPPATAVPTPVEAAPGNLPEWDGVLTGRLVWDVASSSVLPGEGYIELIQKPKSGVWSARESEDTIATGILGEDIGNGSVPFTIRYDPTLIDPDKDYAIIAEFSDVVVTAPLVGGGILFSNTIGYGVEPPRVLTKGRPHKDVEVKLAITYIVT